MRYLSSALAGMLLACSDDLALSVEDDAAPAKTFVAIMESQSNGTPHELSSTLTVAAYAAAYPAVQMRMKSAPDPLLNWETYSGDMAAVTFNGGTRIGAYASLMRDLDEALPNVWAVGVRAVGGAYSYELAAIHADSMSWLATSMAETGCTQLAVVIIHGEADSRGEVTANAYDDYLNALIADIRVTYPTAIVAFNKLHADVSPGFYVYKSQLRTSQDNVGATLTNGGMITMDDYPLSVDLAHFTADGLMELGSRLAVPIAAAKGIFLKPVARFGTSILQRAVTFTDTSIGRGATIAGVAWSPGGAGSWTSGSATSSPSTFTYTADGTYNSSHTITDSNGRTSTSTTAQVSVIGGIAGVTRDAASGQYVPADTTESRALLNALSLTGKANPIGIRLCQETTPSNLADSAGTVGVLAQGSTPIYRQVITGMTRLGVGCVDGTAKVFSSTSASLPNIATESFLVVMQLQMPASAPAVNRSIASMGTAANRAHVGIEATTGKLRATSGASAAVLSAASVCNGGRAIVALRVNRGVLECDAWIKPYGVAIQKITPTANSGMTGERLHFGAQDGALSASGALLAHQLEFGFEDWSDADVETLIAGLEGL